jgi:hypothetical protein
VLAMERMEKTADDLDSEARRVWKPLTIRRKDIERPHRKFLSNSQLVEEYCDSLWTNHESAYNIRLEHNNIDREPKAQRSI